MIVFIRSEPPGEGLERSSCGADGSHLDLDWDGERWVESGDIQDLFLKCPGRTSRRPG